MNDYLYHSQINLLHEYCYNIRKCALCMIRRNGMATPSFLSGSRYLMIGEAPGKEEAIREQPFVGPAGNHLTQTVRDVGFVMGDFAIINSIQCRPIVGGKNGKPSKGDMHRCKYHIEKFISILKPKKILLLGNYAKAQMLGGDIGGIKALNATEAEVKGIPAVLSVHPAVCIYQGDEGKNLLREAITKFKEIK